MKVYRQQYQPTCGPRSLQTVFGYYGKYPEYKDILRVCETDSVGTPLENISKAVKYFGFDFIEYVGKSVTIEKIRKHTDIGELTLIHWFTGTQTISDSHLAVSYSVDDKHVYLIDTSSHLYVEPYIFMKHGMLKKCWKYHPDTRWALAIKP